MKNAGGNQPIHSSLPCPWVSVVTCSSRCVWWDVVGKLPSLTISSEKLSGSWGRSTALSTLPSEWGQSSLVSLREHDPGGAAQGRLTLELNVCCKDLEMLEAFAGDANPLVNAYLHELLQWLFYLTNFLHAEIGPNVCRNQIQRKASIKMSTSSKGREQNFQTPSRSKKHLQQHRFLLLLYISRTQNNIQILSYCRPPYCRAMLLLGENWKQRYLVAYLMPHC